MNQWILPMAFVALVLIVGAFAFVNAQTAIGASVGNSGSTQKAASCGMTGCAGGCTAESNCGSSSCGAANGGSCGCGK